MMETFTVRCAKCRREVRAWPLLHPACSPRDWAYCISDDPARYEYVPASADRVKVRGR